MNKQILSIIISCFNCSKTIKRTLDSIDFSDNRVIIYLINDGSQDNIDQIIHPYIENYKNIRYIKKQNGNQGSCINYALKLINTKYFCLLDSDDFYTYKSLKKVLNIISNLKYDCDVIRVNHHFFYDTKNKKFSKNLVSKTWKLIKYVDIKKLKNHSIPTIHSSIYLTKNFQNIKPLLEDISFTDLILYIHAIINAKKIAFINRHIFLYNYYINPGKQTISVENTAKKIQQLVNVFCEILALLPKNINNLCANHIKWITVEIRYVLYWIFYIESIDKTKSNLRKKIIIRVCINKLNKFLNENNQYKKYLKTFVVNAYNNFPILSSKVTRFVTKFIYSDFMKITKNKKSKN